MKLINRYWQTFWQPSINRKLFIITFSLYLLCLGALVWMISPLSSHQKLLPPEFPLFYSLPKGKDQLATINSFYILIVIMGSIFVFDLISSVILSIKWKLISQIMLWTALLCVCIMSYSLIRIYLLVG